MCVVAEPGFLGGLLRTGGVVKVDLCLGCGMVLVNIVGYVGGDGMGG
jgi:hypothetical protein